MIRKVCLVTGLLMGLVACKEDPCDSVTCLNGSTCVEGVCECREGYTGASCETFLLEKFLGNYTVSYQGCFVTSPNHRVAIGQASVGSADLQIIDLGDYDCPVGGPITLSAEPNGNQLSIPSQVFDCGLIQYTFSGSGALEGDTLTMNFVVTYASDGQSQQDVCTAVLIK
jgi:hypothetical protein